MIIIVLKIFVFQKKQLKSQQKFKPCVRKLPLLLETNQFKSWCVIASQGVFLSRSVF